MNYIYTVQKVMEFLKEKRVCSSSRASHQECYAKFAEYLNNNRLTYSNDAVKQWFSSIKNIYPRQKCYFWNQYMIQLTEMASIGTISDRHLYQTRPAYEKVPESLKPRLEEYLESCQGKYTKHTWERAKIYCSEAMLILNDGGITAIENVTYQDIISLYNADLFCTDKTKALILGHAAMMLSYFADKKLCKKSYSMLLDSQMYQHVGILSEFSKTNRTAIEQLRIKNHDLPSNALYDSIENFICTLQDYGYVGTTLYLARHSLTALYLFLDIHKIDYHPEIAWAWFSELRKVLGSSWRHWRRVLKCYEEYITTGNIYPDKSYCYKTDAIETLPEWCREPILALLNQKKREFRSAGTIRAAQYPCIRFCSYLIEIGFSTFADVTPTVINGFSRTDQHKTFKGRSSYFTVVRQFLEYLENKDYISNKSLHNSLSAGTAPIEKVVDILTDDQVSRVNDYRSSHCHPIELRNAAMVMIGLKMGFRASDVVNLKLSDINWKKRQITIIQQKTQAQLTLPMPVDAGNSIYAYLKNGRPKSNSGYLFIRHNAPFGKLTIKNCTKALYCILPERVNVSGGGFHVTRRTFATLLLRNNAGINTVIDSLGHHDNTSVMLYLSLDEERIKSCALSLSDTGLILQKGGLL